MFCRNNQHNQYGLPGTPSVALPAVRTLRRLHHAMQVGLPRHLESAGKWSGCVCGHGPNLWPRIQPSASLWKWVQPSSSLWQQLPGLVVAHGVRGCPQARWISTDLTASLRFSTLNITWPSSVLSAAERSDPPPSVSLEFLPLISHIVGSKPKSPLFKFYTDATNT